jgi:catechol 2,3-dioxygenase-like lactoylglutathione lyase family enzyme
VIESTTVTLFVSNMDRSVSFYRDALGLTLTGRWGDEYATLGSASGVTIGLHPAPHNTSLQAEASSSSVQIGFAVAGRLEDAIATLHGRGVVFSVPPVDDTQLRLAHFRDPDGHSLYIAEVRRWD